MSRIPRLLPLLAVAIGGVLALKVVSGMEGAPDFLRQATAFAEEAAPGEAAKKAARKGKADPEAQVTPASAGAVAPRAPAAVCATSAADLAKEAGLSPAELAVLQGLQARRGDLDSRSQAIDTQMAVLGAAEVKVDVKLKALADLRAEIQALLGQADAKQQEEVARLVTVYQAMRPQDAAAVMMQLDDKVRVPVAAAMKPRALAAILAKMTPGEAKKLTENLAGRFAAQALAQRAATATPAPAAAANPTPPTKAAAAPPAKAPAKARPRANPARSAPAPTPARPAAATPPAVASPPGPSTGQPPA